MHSEDTAVQVTHAYMNLRVRQNKEVNKYKRKYKKKKHKDRRQGQVINTK